MVAVRLRALVHLMGAGGTVASTFNIQHSTFNVQIRPAVLAFRPLVRMESGIGYMVAGS